LHAGAGGFALLQSAIGIGAICGALLAGEIVSDRRRRIALVAGVVLSAGGYFVLAVSYSLPLSVAGMGVFGVGFFIANVVSQSVLLTVSDDDYRGRVMGLHSTLVVGCSPIAALVSGALASIIGLTATLVIAVVVMLVYCAWFVLSGASRSVAVDEVLDERVAPDGGT
jgi:MFS family permease